MVQLVGMLAADNNCALQDALSVWKALSCLEAIAAQHQKPAVASSSCFVGQRTWDGYDGERQQLIVDDMEYMNKDITTVLLQSHVGNVGRCLGTNMEDLCNRNVTTYF